MKPRVVLPKTPLIVLAALVLANPMALAQAGGTTAPLTGVVTDASGGVLVGAGVTVKNNATGAESRAVTDANGRFVVPALNPGTYTVTISLNGSKTHVLAEVPLTTATPASVNAVLQVGGIAETVTVQGGFDIVQTQTAAVQQTMIVQQIVQPRADARGYSLGTPSGLGRMFSDRN